MQPGVASLVPNWYNQNGDHFSEKYPAWGKVFWNEMILTAFFVSVILTAKYLNGAKDLFLNGLVIGLTLFTVICIGGGLSGGCFNPAVGLVQPLFQSMLSETDNLGSVKNTTS